MVAPSFSNSAIRLLHRVTYLKNYREHDSYITRQLLSYYLTTSHTRYYWYYRKKPPPILIQLVHTEPQKFPLCSSTIFFVIQSPHHSDPVYRCGGEGSLQLVMTCSIRFERLEALSGLPHHPDFVHRCDGSGSPELATTCSILFQCFQDLSGQSSSAVPAIYFYESTMILASILGNYTIDMVKDLSP